MVERDVTISDIGDRAVFPDDPRREPGIDYQKQKLHEKGYPGLSRTSPGLPSTSQADVMAMKVSDPAMYAMPREDVLKLQNEPAVWREQIGRDTVTYEIHNIPNKQAMRIVQDILPKALDLYLKKSKDYGGNVMDRFNLGQKAAIPDMARKFGKLIDAIWRDQPLQFEQPDEILMDLIGHILIILDQRAQDE